MSKYEPRAEDLRRALGLELYTLSWTYRKGKVYLTVKCKGQMFFNQNSRFLIMDTLKKWYDDPHMTSAGPYSTTYFVLDFWKALKR